MIVNCVRPKHIIAMFFSGWIRSLTMSPNSIIVQRRTITNGISTHNMETTMHTAAPNEEPLSPMWTGWAGMYLTKQSYKIIFWNYIVFTMNYAALCTLSAILRIHVLIIGASLWHTQMSLIILNNTCRRLRESPTNGTLTTRITYLKTKRFKVGVIIPLWL